MLVMFNLVNHLVFKDKERFTEDVTIKCLFMWTIYLVFIFLSFRLSET